MKKLIAFALFPLVLVGCMTPQQWAYVKQKPKTKSSADVAIAGYDAEIASNNAQMDELVKKVEAHRAQRLADRKKFVAENPNDPFLSSILAGNVQIGMDLPEVNATRFDCVVKAQYVDGFAEVCGETNADIGTVLSFDGSGKVVGIVE